MGNKEKLFEILLKENTSYERKVVILNIKVMINEDIPELSEERIRSVSFGVDRLASSSDYMNILSIMQIATYINSCR